MNEIKIAPSILSADFSKIGEEIKNITLEGADVIHLDVMDGNFVKNITFGPKFVKDVRGFSNAVFDAHLMILNPWKYIEKFAEAGADIITVHEEACKGDLIKTLLDIKALNKKCGAVINPDTPAESIFDALEYCDMVLVMSVFPGFGGQKFIADVLPKVETLAKRIQSLNKKIDLEIDGGITLENVRSVKDAGANVIVAGNTIFKEQNRAEIIKKLRTL